MNVVAPEQPDRYRGRRRRLLLPFTGKAGGAALPALLVAASIVTVLLVVGIAQLLPKSAAGIIPSGAVSRSATGPANTAPESSPAKAGGPVATTPRPRGSTNAVADPRTTNPSATTSPSPTGTGHYPAWRAGHGYTAGDRVSYAGHDYQCLQTHTSQIGWEPSNTPALWKPLT
jgi:hypothetical protein